MHYMCIYIHIVHVRFVMDPAVIEEDREAVTAFFRAQPLFFDGTRRSVYLVAWLHDMERIFQLCHIPGRLQVQLAVRCLYGDARLWWIETGERQVPYNTWPQFYAVVHGRFGPQISRWGLGAPDRCNTWVLSLNTCRTSLTFYFRKYSMKRFV